MIKRILHIILFCVFGGMAFGQSGWVNGHVSLDSLSTPLEGVEVVLDPGYLTAETDKDGFFDFGEVRQGQYKLSIYAGDGPVYSEVISVKTDTHSVEIQLEATRSYQLGLVEIREEDEGFGVSRMRAVENFGIYAAKKNEVINLEKLNANLANNNSRQIFSGVSGLNIWESDGAGLQLGIGGRGLSPNRTSNFNVRQNGYDISADALGYPESYYTPPSEALARIEVIRGAASLQYGTQFGGMLNFIFKDGPKDKPIEVTTRQTVGSWGFFNSFNSVGGTVGKWNYYAYAQFKRGKGWRENSQFDVKSAHASLHRKFSKNFKLGLESTHMYYLAQQPGGLTDAMFNLDPRQSIRSRNWFKVNWNLFAMTADLRLTDRTKINSRTFGLIAGRQALGVIGLANRADPMEERDLIVGGFRNFGNETRLLHKYRVKKLPAAFLAGVRYYHGSATGAQGLANDGSGPDFEFLNPDLPENSDFRFPSRNVSFFAENLIHFSPRFSMTLGGRYEFIRTGARGYFFERSMDLAGNIIFEQQLEDSTTRNRGLFLGGLGLSFKLSPTSEIYANASQNYRAINFNDLRVVNPNFRVDENLQDERGYNADLGIRGKVGNFLRYDMSLFYLNYSDRIGLILKQDSVLFNLYRFRTNIADSYTIGMESYVELDFFRMLNPANKNTSLSLFTNIALIRARYVNSEETAINNNEVELVPPITLRTGLNFRHKGFGASLQYSYTHRHFTDATNAEQTVSAVNGLIPSYYVMDFSLSYEWRFLKFEGSINNLTNNVYFTRRASGYPGPGIIPSDGRAFFLTVQAKF